jgi:hypothetical protein
MYTADQYEDMPLVMAEHLKGFGQAMREIKHKEAQFRRLV